MDRLETWPKLRPVSMYRKLASIPLSCWSTARPSAVERVHPVLGESVGLGRARHQWPSTRRRGRMNRQRGGYGRGTEAYGGAPMNDPMRILKADHREVERLLTKLTETDEGSARDKLAHEINTK